MEGKQASTFPPSKSFPYSDPKDRSYSISIGVFSYTGNEAKLGMRRGLTTTIFLHIRMHQHSVDDGNVY